MFDPSGFAFEKRDSRFFRDQSQTLYDHTRKSGKPHPSSARCIPNEVRVICKCQMVLRRMQSDTSYTQICVDGRDGLVPVAEI